MKTIKARCTVAEGPRWNAAENTLYWVDITEGRVYRRRKGGENEVYYPNLGKIGSVEFAPEGGLILFTEHCEVYASCFGCNPSRVCVLADHANTRFNDVFNAGGGVYFCGVAPIRPDVRGELWRFDLKTRSFSCIEGATAGMPNGMGVSPDRRTFYFTVSDEKCIYAYDFDVTAKTIFNRRILCRDFADPGCPDGICVDPSDGTLWVAMWDGFRLEHRSTRGKLLGEVRFPMPKVTSVEAANGKLYVTTANLPFDESAAKTLDAGSLFVL